ncbi:MAG: sodium ABC transporter [Candidatus Thermofonsia Clade 1 bacterium]|uniref:Sodium ABC transporter n=1 Tax=Candidatus Thermofonsia Clade 1 bacterium TaxID=2364210 RepID=A0A2M8PBQ9_9CHLR|nr:MAG: sodium ABC transporter [Candidatus Thermofonsia Clade 1 bacterium]RMF49642.1 MAG: ATP-binding cassette domain-containing protein [Chloroflexota bacterium]
MTKRYGEKVAVDDVSFEVKRGEIFSLLGPNGAGKTTTIRMILDIIKPDRGSIRVLGAPFSEATKDRVGYLPEERGLYKNVPLVELLSYLGMLKGMKRREAEQRAAQLLEELDLGAYKKRKVRELSRGMSQKVQFAATIIHRPELLIIDEPFAGLDPVNTEIIKNMIFRLRSEGATVVMSIHEMHQVEEMANRLLMIHQGRRVLYGEVDEVRQRYAEKAVIVSGQGDWSALRGVVRAQPDENGRNIMLHLDDQTTPAQILAELANNPNYSVRSFALAVPRLNDIFIRVAGGEAKIAASALNAVEVRHELA